MMLNLGKYWTTIQLYHVFWPYIINGLLFLSNRVYLVVIFIKLSRSRSLLYLNVYVINAFRPLWLIGLIVIYFCLTKLCSSSSEHLLVRFVQTTRVHYRSVRSLQLWRRETRQLSKYGVGWELWRVNTELRRIFTSRHAINLYFKHGKLWFKYYRLTWMCFVRWKIRKLWTSCGSIFDSWHADLAIWSFLILADTRMLEILLSCSTRLFSHCQHNDVLRAVHWCKSKE